MAQPTLVPEQKVNYTWTRAAVAPPGKQDARFNFGRITAMQALGDATTAFPANGWTRFPGVVRAARANAVLGWRRQPVHADRLGVALPDRPA
jgi:hypothetical protein